MRKIIRIDIYGDTFPENTTRHYSSNFRLLPKKVKKDDGEVFHKNLWECRTTQKREFPPEAISFISLIFKEIPAIKVIGLAPNFITVGRYKRKYLHVSWSQIDTEIVKIIETNWYVKAYHRESSFLE